MEVGASRTAARHNSRAVHGDMATPVEKIRKYNMKQIKLRCNNQNNTHNSTLALIISTLTLRATKDVCLQCI